MDRATQLRLEQMLARFGARMRAQIESNRLSQHGIDVEDVEQEVRIRLWKTLERDPNAELPASYIQRTVASALIDAVRRAQVRPTEALPETEEGLVDLPGLGHGPDRSTLDAQHIAHLRVCMQALPVRRRLPLQLYLQGYALQEVADLTDLTLDSARKLVYRGLDEIKQRLRVLGMDNFDD
ncbi:RNA polymerase sigma factor [Aquimonas sp.]|jgi:RNA polymerase sigma-70 factor (ECF subfamily)|uniref:RNA polymerase sigma factor n=1 Tax=Aquimonas sp. TaxID=1872588 RepID=UPI0037C10F71